MIENLSERLKAKRIELDNVEAAKIEYEHNQFMEARKKALAFMPEVRELFKICEEIYDNGFVIPYSGHSTRRQERFYSDGWFHNFGFMNCSNSKSHQFVPKWVGWFNGGACGAWDICCDGEGIYSIYEDSRWSEIKKFGTVSKSDYDKFVERWPQFRDDFYKWLDTELLNDT